jgi:ferredoxin
MVEYYDLKVDPYELHNKHEDGDPTKMAMLKKRLGEFMECWGDQCFDPPEHPEPLPPPPPPPGFNATLVFENLCVSCGACEEKDLLRLETQSATNCGGFRLGPDVTGNHNQVQSGESLKCWNIEDAHCAVGSTMYMHSCWQAGPNGARKADEWTFDPKQKVFRSGICTGMCAAKAGGPPASPAIVLDYCNSSAAIGWNVVTHY